MCFSLFPKAPFHQEKLLLAHLRLEGDVIAVKSLVVWDVVGRTPVGIGSMWLTSGSTYGVKRDTFDTARHVAAA